MDEVIEMPSLKHVRDTGHPIVQSFERGEDWLWCYIDEVVPAQAARKW
jgi:hypothetical protein